jgi:hypothetical protein
VLFRGGAVDFVEGVRMEIYVVSDGLSLQHEQYPPDMCRNLPVSFRGACLGGIGCTSSGSWSAGAAWLDRKLEKSKAHARSFMLGVETPFQASPHATQAFGE